MPIFSIVRIVPLRFLCIYTLLIVLPFSIALADEESSFDQAFSMEGPKIEEFPLPTKNSLPSGIGVDSRGRIWYTAQGVNRIGFIDPETTEIKEFALPSAAALPKSSWKYDPVKKIPPKPEDLYNVYSVGSPGELIIDSKDRVWFVELLGNSLGLFDPATKKFTEYPIPTPNSQPYSLVADKKNNIWFVEGNANKIGKLDFEKKKIQEYSMPKGEHKFTSIAIDARQNIWVADIADNSIIMFIPSEKKIKRYPITEALATPQALYVTSNGQIWFAMAKKRQIAMLDPSSGLITKIVLPGYTSVPHDILVDKSGKVWWIDNFRNKVGFFDTINLKLNEWDIPTMNAIPMRMVMDQKGDIWFTESGLEANKIAKLVVSSIPKKKPGDLKKSARGENPGKPASGDNPEARWSPMFLLVMLLAIVILIISFKVLTRKKSS